MCAGSDCLDKKIANKYHSELISEVKAQAKRSSGSQKEKLGRYIGTNKTLYVIETKTQRGIIKEWIRKHPDLAGAEYVELLSSLFQGESVNEISIAGELLVALPGLRKTVEPRYLGTWLDRLHGWGEVDSLCQSRFSAAEVLADWKQWQGLLSNLAVNDNINKRRASLVLLTKPVRDSNDKRLAGMAFMNIDRLKKERNILVTKAMSWLLRDLIKHNRQRVEAYLKENEDALPKIAVRETRMKLLTGRKTTRRTKPS